MNTAPLTRVTAVLTAALVLSACGIVDEDDDFLDQGPRNMAKAAFAEMRQTTSLRILGTIEDESGRTRVDISVGDTGCIARFWADEGQLSLIKNTDGAWLQADARFWRSEASSPREAEMLSPYSDSWITVRDENEFTGLCDLKSFVKNFTVTEKDTDDTIRVGDVEEVGGEDAVPLHGRGKKGRATVWVAVDAPHHVVKMVLRKGGKKQELFLSHFGIGVDAEAPRKKDTVVIPGV
ncbi:hypothetical protein GCM10023339_77310 [Alloalcanivorax gelatiniphagus]